MTTAYSPARRAQGGVWDLFKLERGRPSCGLNLALNSFAQSGSWRCLDGVISLAVGCVVSPGLPGFLQARSGQWEITHDSDGSLDTKGHCFPSLSRSLSRSLSLSIWQLMQKKLKPNSNSMSQIKLNVIK